MDLGLRSGSRTTPALCVHSDQATGSPVKNERSIGPLGVFRRVVKFRHTSVRVPHVTAATQRQRRASERAGQRLGKGSEAVPPPSDHRCTDGRSGADRSSHGSVIGLFLEQYVLFIQNYQYFQVSPERIVWAWGDRRTAPPRDCQQKRAAPK